MKKCSAKKELSEQYKKNERVQNSTLLYFQAKKRTQAKDNNKMIQKVIVIFFVRYSLTILLSNKAPNNDQGAAYVSRNSSFDNIFLSILLALSRCLFFSTREQTTRIN